MDKIIIYDDRVQVKVDGETTWLNQENMALLFNVEIPAISKHIKNIYEIGELQPSGTISKMEIVQKEGSREVKRHIDFYNLDMIISVGYRVNSASAVKFRQWATKILKEYMIKGFAIDDERLKNTKNSYIDELVKKVKDIRASELNFYQKVRELLKLSSDYNASNQETHLFFANVQNKLLYAITGKTAGEIIFQRADHKEINMGLTSFAGSIVRVADIYISKNYLKEEEIRKLSNLTNMFLDYVENYIEQIQEQIFMDDWEKNTDAFLKFNRFKCSAGRGLRTPSSPFQNNFNNKLIYNICQ